MTLVKFESALPVDLQNQGPLKREAEAEAVKEFARRVKDWDMLDHAVDQQIADQRALVEFWDKHVSVRESAGGNQTRSSAERRSTVSQAIAEEQSGIRHQKVSKWRQRLLDPDSYRDLLRGPSYRKAMLERGSSDLRGASGTGENEWHTPSRYIDLARMVLGEIDLDPATSDAAQALIRATKYYTKQSDGLRHEWHGRIWLNPPYAQPLISQFISKLAEERLRGHVTAAIVLTHNYTDTRWFHKLIASADAICFTRGRVRFHDGDKIAAPTQGQLFTYLGDDVCGFAAAFEPVGSVMPCRFAPHVLESLDVA